MSKGGRRPGAGAKKGSKQSRTVEKQAILKRFRERIAEQVDPLIDAQIAAALGVTHIMARDKAGRWQQVTDPLVMARVLDSGETFYRLTARNPDVQALRDCWDRLFGKAPQALELTGAERDALVIRWAD